MPQPHPTGHEPQNMLLLDAAPVAATGADVSHKKRAAKSSPSAGY
jgi:hypothetical protein